ncbi:hypothetical protein NDU88_003334 [Pleurodeles waltl]|uniref:Uncharacterized protein n=1 Tax=Pleurodeles waltl TaxID=8319 RepID=A0AAV7VH27_PLEWA|nr:hypothetical protein NDU88_003334 [Pleurodeles waltl]
MWGGVSSGWGRCAKIPKAPLPRAGIEQSWSCGNHRDRRPRFPCEDTGAESAQARMVVCWRGRGFATSESNQGEKREVCATLEKKLDLLAVRAQALEESVGVIEEELQLCKEEIQAFKANEQDLQNKLELSENRLRRNNLRILNVPEGVEGTDLKSFMAALIKSAVSLYES